MARIDLSPGTPIPVTADGPYSAIFDWKQEQTDAAALNEKKQAVQKKIMRTNALGEAFRILGEGIAAGQGAPVTQRNPNPFILNAVNEYAKNDMEYINKLEGVKAKKLALGQMDLQYNLNQKATAAEREFQMQMQAQKELTAYARENELLEKQYKLRGLENEAQGARKNVEMANSALLEIEIARKKAQFDRGMGLTGDGSTTGIDISTPPAKGDKDTMEFVTPDTNKTIYLNPGMINYIRTQLQTGKGKYDQSVPQVLRDAMVNKAIKPEALATVFTDQWDYIRDNILPPDVYSQIYGGEPGTVTPQTKKPVSTTPTQVKNDDGTVDLDGDSRQALLGRINEALNNTSLNDVNKIGTVRDFIYNTYQSAGLPMSKIDAEKQARELMKQWRAQQRTK